MKQFRPLKNTVLGITVAVLSFFAVEQLGAQGVAAPLGPKAGPIGGGQRPFEEQYFDADWHQTPGRPTVVSSCVYNRSAIVADKVRVVVEGLDAAGAVVGSTAVQVWSIPAGSYGHFEFPALGRATKYRSRVVAFEQPQAR